MRLESQLSRMNCQTFSTGMARKAPWFRTPRRQRHDGDVGRHRQFARQVPPGLVDQEHRVRARRHRERDLGQVQAHRLGVAPGQHEGRALAVLGADRAEDVGGHGALIFRCGRARADRRPAARDLVLLPDTRFIAEPDLYVGRIDALLARDLVQQGSEAVLKRSIAPAACA